MNIIKQCFGGVTYATFTNGGASVLNGITQSRLETTTSGVTVTGTVAAFHFLYW